MKRPTCSERPSELWWAPGGAIWSANAVSMRSDSSQLAAIRRAQPERFPRRSRSGQHGGIGRVERATRNSSVATRNTTMVASPINNDSSCGDGKRVRVLDYSGVRFGRTG